MAALGRGFSPVVEMPPYLLKTVLLVDAQSPVEDMLKSILKPAVWKIEHARDNREALALAQAKPYDLILTGEKTSGKDDVELLRKIRSVRPHTRLIILTDERTAADVIASMRERAFSYFSKPYSLETLVEMVRNATDGPCWDDGIEVVSATPEWISLLARCDVKTADRLVQFLHEISGLPEEEDVVVGTAFREMLLNAIEHGGNFNPEQYVEISYVRTQKMLMCRIKDPGEGFSLEEAYHAASSNPSQDPLRHAFVRESLGMRPGGYGVLMARHFVDELMYSEKGNEVLLIKYLGRAQPASP
jgi:CheY-like chemotaxis protein